jgi:alkylhydroperoxidase family enzyme
MSHRFPLHGIATAPAKSRPVLQALQQAFGVIPNVAGEIANSPVLARGFIGLFQNVHAGSFSEAEIQVLLLTNAVTNRSAWPVAFHTALALKEGVDDADVAAIRAGALPSDARHAALSGLARTLIERRGQVDEADVDRFCDAGFEPAQALELVGVVAASTITNYAAGMTRPPLEDAFQAHAWAA